MTGGMDNPVDVVFTPGGERIFTTTFLVHPGGGQRDGLIHAIYGGVYGKVHDQIFDASHKWTGPDVMPVLLHLGPAAPCGLTRYESDAFGKDYQDNLFACYFNLHKVSRHVLAPHGPTFTTKDEDFVSSPDLDFHPTDVIEDADGSLVIVDTGGWYKLCCPTSQLHKPDVLGAIYRVRRSGTPRALDPWDADERMAHNDTQPATARDIIKKLDDPRPAVRRRTIENLSRFKTTDAQLAPLREVGAAADASPQLRRNIVWTLARIDEPGARVMVHDFLGDRDETVRQVAIHVVGLWRDKSAGGLRTLLDSPSAQNRRAAAEALGRIGDSRAVPALLEAAGRTDDRILEHSITYALIDIADRRGTEAGLSSANVRTKKAAMVALDQMDGGGLDPRFVAGLLTAADPGLKETASWIVGRHREWALALADVLGERLKLIDLAPADRAGLERQLGRLATRLPSSGCLPVACATHSPPWSAPEQSAGDGLVDLEGRGLAARVD